MDDTVFFGYVVPKMGQMLNLNSLADFLAAAEAGGVSGGARLRGEPKQTVSRRLSALESDLGVRLFERSARGLRLTPEGALLRERGQRILSELEDAQRTIRDSGAAPAGLVRVSAPTLLGQSVLGRVAARVARAYPGLRLEIALADRRVDLVEEGFDAAIRVGAQLDSDLIARVLTEAETFIVASPAFLQRRRAPTMPQDLVDFPCILFGDAGQKAVWSLSDGVRSHRVDVAGPIATNSLKLCLDAAVEGAGLASVPAFVARPLLATGALLRILPDWRTGLAPVRIVYPSRRFLSARLRAFIDETVACFAEIDL